MKKIIFLTLLLTSPAWGAGNKCPLVQGHRGSRGTVPENTLPAFEAALMAEADVLEMDMDVTKDNVVVISHEPRVTPERCLGPDGKALEKAVPIRSLTLAELKKYDCGSLVNAKFPQQLAVPGEHMPTLDEVFAMVEASGYQAAPKVEFNIETKIFPSEPELTPSPAEFAGLVMDVIKKHGMENRVIVQSFDVRTLKEIKKLNPAVRTAQLTSDNLLDIAPALKAAGTDIWSPNYLWITTSAVHAAQTAGLQVAPWTLNTKKDWDFALEAGVDAIITDYPAALVEYLQEKKLR